MKIDSAQICFVAFLGFTVNAGDWDDWDEGGSWLGRNAFGMNNRRAPSRNSWGLWGNDDDSSSDDDDRMQLTRGSRSNRWSSDDDDYRENRWNRGYGDDDDSSDDDDDDYRWGRRAVSNTGRRRGDNRRNSRRQRFDDDDDDDSNGGLFGLLSGLRGQRNTRPVSNRRTVQRQQPMRNTWSNTHFLRNFFG